MMARVKLLAERINALTVRERFLLFAALIGILGAVTDAVFITPLLKQQKALVAQIDRKSTEMDILREKVDAEVMSRSLGRAAELATGLAEVQRELLDVEREIAGMSAIGRDPVAMSALLGRVLRQTEKVALVRVIQAGSDSAVVLPVAGTVIASTANRGAIDVTLAGNYLDLLDYLASLEKSLPQARWGGVRMKAEAMPAQVTVRIVTGQGQ